MPLKRPKVKKKPKKRSPTYYRKLCVVQAKLEAKKKANYICERCGVKVEGANAHGSHILPEGAYPLMSAEVKNILCLCYRCHILFWHKNPHEATEFFNNKWPGRYQELRNMADEKKKHIVNWELKWNQINEKN